MNYDFFVIVKEKLENQYPENNLGFNMYCEFMYTLMITLMTRKDWFVDSSRGVEGTPLLDRIVMTIEHNSLLGVESLLRVTSVLLIRIEYKPETEGFIDDASQFTKRNTRFTKYRFFQTYWPSEIVNILDGNELRKIEELYEMRHWTDDEYLDNSNGKVSRSLNIEFIRTIMKLSMMMFAKMVEFGQSKNVETQNIFKAFEDSVEIMNEEGHNNKVDVSNYMATIYFGPQRYVSHCNNIDLDVVGSNISFSETLTNVEGLSETGTLKHKVSEKLMLLPTTSRSMLLQ
jgi:hypothetical protein